MTPDDSIKAIILKILSRHRGEPNRIARKRLLSEINYTILGRITDRHMRTLLEELRNEERGILICSSLQGGYFIAKDENELDKLLRADEKRAHAILRRVRFQRKYAALLDGGQLEMFG